MTKVPLTTSKYLMQKNKNIEINNGTIKIWVWVDVDIAYEKIERSADSSQAVAMVAANAREAIWNDRRAQVDR